MFAIQARPQPSVHVNDNDLLNDNEVESHRTAYNAAFDELGLNWHWDPVTYALLPMQGAAGVRHYLESEQRHLLRAYDADFLVQAIEAAKARCLAVINASRESALA